VIDLANVRDLTFILANLRDEDRQEVVAHLGAFHNYNLAVSCLQAGPAFVAYTKQDQPAFAFGAAHYSPTTVSAWAYGTKKAWRVLPAVTRFVLGPLASDLRDKGYRYAEARALMINTPALQWMQEHLGAKILTELYGFGTMGEAFVLLRRKL
jgi:hypothetical protein